MTRKIIQSDLNQKQFSHKKLYNLLYLSQVSSDNNLRLTTKKKQINMH
jgi:hypothetical protein